MEGGTTGATTPKPKPVGNPGSFRLKKEEVARRRGQEELIPGLPGFISGSRGQDIEIGSHIQGSGGTMSLLSLA